jgi:hypothetical protein
MIPRSAAGLTAYSLVVITASFAEILRAPPGELY